MFPVLFQVSKPAELEWGKTISQLKRNQHECLVINNHDRKGVPYTTLLLLILFIFFACSQQCIDIIFRCKGIIKHVSQQYKMEIAYFLNYLQFQNYLPYHLLCKWGYNWTISHLINRTYAHIWSKPHLFLKATSLSISKQ